jgi:peptidoglycan glycosyltransferase
VKNAGGKCNFSVEEVVRKRSDRSWNRLAYSNWRDFQKELQRQYAAKRSRPRKVALTVLVLFGLFGLYPLLGRLQTPLATGQSRTQGAIGSGSRRFDKTKLRHLLDKKDFNNLTTKNLDIRLGKEELHVETSLNVGLQKYLLDRLDRKDSRAIGIVVMDPVTGRVLAMAGFDRAAPSVNPCLHSNFPSASVFKIVTAAAAVEHGIERAAFARPYP